MISRIEILFVKFPQRQFFVLKVDCLVVKGIDVVGIYNIGFTYP